MAEATVAAPQNVMRDLKIEKLVISTFAFLRYRFFCDAPITFNTLRMIYGARLAGEARRVDAEKGNAPAERNWHLISKEQSALDGRRMDQPDRE